MKRFLIILSYFFSVTTIAQEVKTQKDILGIPNTDLVKDFNLKIKGSIKPEVITKTTLTDIGFSFKGSSFEYLKNDYLVEELTFKDYNLIKHRQYSNFSGFKTDVTSYYFYNSNNKLSKRSFKEEKGKGNQTTTFDYKNGKISQIRDFGKLGNGNTFDNIKNFTQNSNYLSYELNDKTFTYQFKNGLISKLQTLDNKTNDSRITKYNYNSDNFLTDITNGSSIDLYELNENNLIKKEIKKEYNKHYKYVFDKYGNWIIAYPLSVTTKGLYGSRFSFHIREIKYANGDITGGKSLESNNLKEQLIKVRSELYTKLIGFTATWIKYEKDSYNFRLNHSFVTKECSTGFMNKSLLVFHKPSKSLYVCEEFADKEIEKTYPAKKLDIDLTYGYWYKNKNGSVAVFSADGAYIKEHSLYKYDTNNIDVIYQGKNESNKVVLKNYKNAKIYTVYPVIEYKFSGIKSIVNNAESVTKKLEKVSNYLGGECIKGDCVNGYGEKKFSNGIAEGFFKDGQPYGPMHTTNHYKKSSLFTSYAGSFDKKDAFTYEFNGNELTIFSNKNKTLGFFNDAKKKETYELIFKNGKPITKKLLKYNSDSGCMLGNCTNGIGVYKYNNGAIYFGSFSSGKRHGFGKIDFKTGEYYIGEFKYSSYHGLGTFVWKKDDYYMGMYKDNKFHGKGIRAWSKSNYKAGIWNNGNYSGKVSKQSSSNSSNSKITNNISDSTGFNIFDEQTSKRLSTKKAKEIAEYINIMMYKYSSSPAEIKNKKLADYLHSVYTIKPNELFSVAMKVNNFNKGVTANLPNHIQTYLRDRARGVIKGYNQYINSEETKDKIKKNGSGLNNN